MFLLQCLIDELWGPGPQVSTPGQAGKRASTLEKQPCHGPSTSFRNTEPTELEDFFEMFYNENCKSSPKN